MFIFYKTIPNFAMDQIFVPLGILLGEVLHLIQRIWQILQTQVTLTVKYNAYVYICVKLSEL